MAKKIALVVATILPLAAACGRAGDGAREQTDSGRAAADYACLVPPPLFGLRLGDSIASMRATIGRPIDSVRSVDEADGGRVATITYRFPRADVRLVRGRVDRIVATDRGGWPRGLAVGSTRSEVDRYTGEHRLLRMTSGDTLEIAVCPDAWVLLHFAPSASGQRVRRVELLANRP
jgi:hypothetical protein